MPFHTRPGKLPGPSGSLAPQKRVPADDLEIIEFLLTEGSFESSVEVTETVLKCKHIGGNITTKLLNKLGPLCVDFMIYQGIFIIERTNPIN